MAFKGAIKGSCGHTGDESITARLAGDVDRALAAPLAVAKPDAWATADPTASEQATEAELLGRRLPSHYIYIHIYIYIYEDETLIALDQGAGGKK